MTRTITTAKMTATQTAKVWNDYWAMPYGEYHKCRLVMDLSFSESYSGAVRVLKTMKNKDHRVSTADQSWLIKPYGCGVMLTSGCWAPKWFQPLQADLDVTCKPNCTLYDWSVFICHNLSTRNGLISKARKIEGSFDRHASRYVAVGFDQFLVYSVSEVGKTVTWRLKEVQNR